MSAQRRQPKRRAVKRRNPAYTTHEIERGKWGIIGPDGPTHKWFTSQARAQAWIDANAGAEVKKWTGKGSQQPFDFRGKAAEQADPHAEAAAAKRTEAAERVRREAAEQAERIRQRQASEAAERAAAREEARRAERAREWREQRDQERAAQAARAEAAERLEQARREAEERGRQQQAEHEAREAHMRSERAREEAAREAREAYERHQARERAAKEQQERERAEEDARRQARWGEKEQERSESDDRRGRASKEKAKKQREAREGKGKAGKAPKVEWVHVGVNTWAGFETVGGKDRALFTGVQKDSQNFWTKRRGQGPQYQVIGTAPLGVYGYGVHERLKANNLRMDVGKNYGTFPTLEDARKAAIAEDRRLQGDPGFYQDRQDAERDAAEKQRQAAEREAARERARAERDAAENQRAAARIASGPWTASTNLTWSVTQSTYGSSAHAIGPDGKALFCFAYRRNNGDRWGIYTVTGEFVARSNEQGVPKAECVDYAARRLPMYARSQEPWPPRQPPRWQNVRDRIEAEYKRQEDDARRRSGYGGGSYRSAPPPPAGLHGFKRYADLARMAAAGSGGSDNERALAARLMAKMQAEWDAANSTDREGLRAKWHRNPARMNPARRPPGRRHPRRGA